MRICLALSCIVLPALLMAQPVTKDAFGIVPTSDLGAARAQWAGLQTNENGAEVMIPAQEPATAIILVGPKSIVAGFEDGHAVVLGLDRHGNMVDGVEVNFVLGAGQSEQVVMRNGIAGVLFRPPPVAGYFLAGASVGGIQSARADYRVSANLATVQPNLLPWDAPVQLETFAPIRSAPLVDGFGNVVDNGVGLMALLTNTDGTVTALTTTVVDGSAKGVLLSRDIPATTQGTIALGDNVSPATRFNVAVWGISEPTDIFIWPLPSLNAVQARIGPVMTDAGYLLPDGAALAARFTSSDGQVFEADGWVLDGHLDLTIPLDPQTAPFEVRLTSALREQVQTVAVSSAPETLKIRGAE